MAKKILMKSSGGYKYDLDYKALRTEALSLGYTLPTDEVSVHQDNFIIGLKANGIYSKLDLLYVFASDGQLEYNLLNWISPTDYKIPVVLGNTSMVPNQEVTFVNQHTNNFIPKIHAVNYGLNSVSLGYKTGTLGIMDSNDCMVGASGENPDTLNQINDATMWYSGGYNSNMYINSKYPVFWGRNPRPDDELSDYFTQIAYDGVNATLFSNGTTPFTQPLTALGLPVNALRFAYASATVSLRIFYMGGFLTRSEETTLLNLFNTYHTNINL